MQYDDNRGETDGNQPPERYDPLAPRQAPPISPPAEPELSQRPPAPEQPVPAPSIQTQPVVSAKKVPEADDGSVTVEGTTYRPAGFMWRMGAFLIDFVILSGFHALLLAFLDYQAPDEQEVMKLLNEMLPAMLSMQSPAADVMARFNDIYVQMRIAGWLNVAICAAYYTVFHTVAGATLGKLCLGLTVLTSKGHRLGFGTALIRYLVRFALSRFFFGGVFTVWFDPRRRTAYDMAAGTNVFRQVPQPVEPERY